MITKKPDAEYDAVYDDLTRRIRRRRKRASRCHRSTAVTMRMETGQQPQQQQQQQPETDTRQISTTVVSLTQLRGLVLPKDTRKYSRCRSRKEPNRYRD